jgi:hypothetical protein
MSGGERRQRALRNGAVPKTGARAGASVDADLTAKARNRHLMLLEKARDGLLMSPS